MGKVCYIQRNSLIKKNSSMNFIELFYYFEYQVTQEDGTTGYFKEYVYESEEAFWGVSFVCVSEDDYVANYNSFDEWASSVTFTEAV